jgi:hypothetical protein
MLHITVTAETIATPEQVLALAGTDFSAHRAKIWANVTEKRLEVHAQGDTHADVTEGGTGIAWFAFERSRYDWSEPGTVKQSVLDSNVLEPGSTWELRVAPRGGGGSTIEMTLKRNFRDSIAGRVGFSLNRLGGRRGWGWYLRSTLKAVERASTETRRPDRGERVDRFTNPAGTAPPCYAFQRNPLGAGRGGSGLVGRPSGGSSRL